jgi:UPF0271 protein
MLKLAWTRSSTQSQGGLTFSLASPLHGFLCAGPLGASLSDCEAVMAWEINCDMGEAYGLYEMGDDEGIMPFITAANVACGFHAADPMVMRRTVRLAKRFGVKVGAHPSLPDREGFGRREMKMRPEEITNAVIYQVGALKGFLEAEGLPLNHIKPHGSLYGMSAKDPVVATAIAEAASVFGVPLYGMSGTHHETHYAAGGAAFVGEFYADLEYGPDGFLIITREHHAVDPAEAAGRVLRAMNEGKVCGTNGQDFSVRAQSVCVHSDTPGALAVAKAVHEALRPARAT